MPPTAHPPGGFRPRDRPNFAPQPLLIDFLFGQKHQQLERVLKKLLCDVTNILGLCRSSLQPIISERDPLANFQSRMSSQIDLINQSVTLIKTQLNQEPGLVAKRLEELEERADSFVQQKTRLIEAFISKSQFEIVSALSQAIRDAKAKPDVVLEAKIDVLVQTISTIKESVQAHDDLLQALRANTEAQTEASSHIAKTLQDILEITEAPKLGEKKKASQNEPKRRAPDPEEDPHDETPSMALGTKNNSPPAMNTRAAKGKARQQAKRRRTS
ncbi:hypothetical protein ISF_09840 [Cordyceps fumosorosea ARSEF 2679]|uniref:Uncharacterized protein n=1 Tax=Cordyceps fumosorosea (strain ARSEF 2679) TaxID=1081104 RepID=A0A166VT59_CORFA|nr:hypothetical protein ISF_10039 [Cordyceps fumosorosea ARSEF 2679]XP_018699367.1 hypothetical protein ISF_09840 [Cordyceps fumosorosea ARSEF 2679]OAA34002.1 hypothetical protein ISF_10039 [Cordyceps fumosorosea ARSEF 2679]OAA39761.1 hypothetical protein ISF_09840 [Cordyceps fumosorosea ARSEF 2679]